jgi:hypothetical protein
MSEMPNFKLQRQGQRCLVSAFGYSPLLIVSVA